MKYVPYEAGFDVDDNERIGSISLMTVYFVERVFGVDIQLKTNQIGHTFCSFYFKEDTPYLNTQLRFAESDAKNFPNEIGVAPYKIIKP